MVETLRSSPGGRATKVSIYLLASQISKKKVRSHLSASGKGPVASSIYLLGGPSQISNQRATKVPCFPNVKQAPTGPFSMQTSDYIPMRLAI